ncbi:MAG: hypothetical protein K0B81_05345 [Candidatus Cloacimonetes bacterium]|nr:hypothetical protein [Candidatus Cloacimonadota bacterium]
MKKIILIICSVGLLFFLTSCDEREGVKPVMEILVENNYLYGEGIDCEINYTDITFKLEGTPSFISETKIFIDFDESQGLFVGDGTSQFVITNTQGIAIGRFIAYETALGATTISASMEVFPSVRGEAIIYLLDLPGIETFEAESTTLSPNGETELFIQLADQSGYIADLTISFSATAGSFEYNSVQTDENGFAHNTYYADEEITIALITASLDICPNVNENLTITIR